MRSAILVPCLAACGFGFVACGDPVAGPGHAPEEGTVARLTEPPRPAGLGQIDPDVVERIEAALERVRAAPDEAAVWGDLGKTYEVVGLRTPAIPCYEQAQLRDPEEPRWWYRSAICRGRIIDVPHALEDIARVIELAPDYGPAYYRRGTYALELGDLDQAWSAFQDAVRVSPAFMGGWVGSARVLLQRDESAEAVRVLETQRERDPRDPQVLKLLVSAYRQAGLEREVVLPEEPAEDAEDDEPGGRFWADPWQSELRSFRRAPESHRLSRMLERGRVDEVIAELETRRATEPEETDYLVMLAEAYYMAERIPDARATYRTLLELEPENVPARMALARYHILGGTSHLALPWLEEVIAIDPDYGPAWAAKGGILYRGDQFERAIPVIRRALELDQREAELWLWLGRSRSIQKDWAGAAESLATYVERQSEDAQARLLLAKACVKSGDVDRAETELALARELGGGIPGTLEEVQRLVERARERAARRAARGVDE